MKSYPQNRVPHIWQSHRQMWVRGRDKWISVLILPLAAFIAVLPLILHGCSCGHDFNFHLLNWMEAARQFSHGNLHPHWAYRPAYNAGEPRFVFYPPLSWTLGAILGLIMPWTWTLIVYTWLALTAAGLALYRLAREFTTPTAALLAATFYLANPYILYTAYERTAYAELLAAAWIPLLLHAILRKKVTIPGIAIAVALLWLTNAPAAVMGCYALALLTLIRLFVPTANPDTPYLDSEMWASHKSTTAPAQLTGAPSFAAFLRRVGHKTFYRPATPLQLAATTTAGTLLGLGVAAFYILPAAYERRYVQITAVLAPGTRIQDNFLFHHTANPIHNSILNTASALAVVLLALTATAFAVAAFRSYLPLPKSRAPHPSQPLREGWEKQTPIVPLAILTLVIAFLLTPLSNFVWQHLPELAFLQFPWRLLAILAAVLAFAMALALTPLSLKPIATAALSTALAAVLTLTCFHLFHQSCSPERSVATSATLFRSNTGAPPYNEYTPTSASNKALSRANPPYWLLADLSSGVNASAPADSTPGSAPTSFTLNSPKPQSLVLNLRDYPAWRITLNQKIVATRLRRNDGLIAIPIPPGRSQVEITYTHTPDQTLGDILTILSLAILLLTFRRKFLPNP